MNHWLIYLIDVFFEVALFVNAALFVPQILRLYRNKHSRDISLTTFAGFNVIQFMIILYGVVHQNWLLACGYGLSLLLCGVVTYLIVYYRFVEVV